MAVSAVIAHPLRLTGLSLPPQVVLLCRLLALTLLLTNHQAQIQTPFLPFLELFDAIPAEVFQFTLRAALVIGSAGLLFTKNTRAFAAITGVTLLLAVLSSRDYYGNHKTLAGVLLLLAALSNVSGPPWLIQWQLGLVYLSAGINKALDPDWAAAGIGNPAYMWFSAHLPPPAAGTIFRWITISAAFALAVLSVVPRFHSAFIWGSGLLQSGLLLVTGDPFHLYFYSMQASLFAFARWPENQFTVIWDGSCGFCRATKEFLQKFDFDPIFDWHPLQSNIGDRYGLTKAQLRQALYAAGPGWLLSGYSAIRRMIVHLPLFAMTLTAAIALSPGPQTRRAIVALTLLFLLPVSDFAGNALYGWVARHRGETCELPEKS